MQTKISRLSATEKAIEVIWELEKNTEISCSIKPEVVVKVHSRSVSKKEDFIQE
jgi:hypothetical protein